MSRPERETNRLKVTTEDLCEILDCLRQLRESGFETKYILLTMHAETEYAVAAME